MLIAWHARLSLREAADVLRTDRRTRRKDEGAQVKTKPSSLHAMKALRDNIRDAAQAMPQKALEAPKSLPGTPPKPSKIKAWGVQNR